MFTVIRKGKVLKKAGEKVILSVSFRERTAEEWEKEGKMESIFQMPSGDMPPNEGEEAIHYMREGER